MTKTHFKKALQSELKQQGFKEQIKEVMDLGVNTAIEIKGFISDKCAQWLQKRYKNGIRLSYSTATTLVTLNTPAEAKELRDEKKNLKNFMIDDNSRNLHQYLTHYNIPFSVGDDLFTVLEGYCDTDLFQMGKDYGKWLERNQK